ncbi:MAG: ShlB/FhaC/HecB family hemolysin secretion/activation protein [Pirellulales bacterium]
MKRIYCIAMLGWCAIASIAAGQDFERYRPLPVEPPPFSPNIPERPLAPATGSDEVLVDRLDAVIVWDHPDRVQPNEAFADAEGVVRRFAAGDSLVHSGRFAATVEPYIGRPITLRNLNQMSRDIILLYRSAGQPVVDVIIPEQKITGGTVQIVITEARVGRVLVQGGCWTDPHRQVHKVECTRRGGRLTESGLAADLYRLNDYPWRRYGVDLEPGDAAGTTDVIFEVDEVFPMRSYMGYDDTGVPNLLLERLFVGATVGDLFGLDSMISYQATTDADFHHLNAHSVFYQIPLCDWWSFEAYGSWAGVDPIVDIGLDQEGESWQAGFAFNHQLVKTPYEESKLSLGFDFKSTNTNVEFGGEQVFNSFAELVSLRLGYELWKRCSCGEYFHMRNDLYVGPGPQFSPSNTSAAFSTIRPDTSPDFIYDRIFMERLWHLPHCWQLLARGTGQVTNERLLWSETLGFGGYDSVRGYDQRTRNGDCGWIVQMELGPQPYQWTNRCRQHQFRWFGFVDMGDAYILHPQAGEDAQQFMVSTGVGFRYAISNRLSLRFDYGYGFREIETTPPSGHQRVHLGLVALFGPQP